MTKNEWAKKATALLKVELAKRSMSYESLRLALAELGIEKTTSNISKTINVGRFSFIFFLQCAKAIGIEKLDLD